VILFKIILAPVLIALVSLAGRKWGPGVSGWLLGIPVNTGPILLFFALEQGREFTASASLGALLGVLAWAAFTLTYAWCCLRFPWWLCTIIGWTACGIAAWVLDLLNINLFWAFILVCGTLAATARFFPKPPAQTVAVAHSPYEIWLRMMTATVFIFVLTGIARPLGPRASGILSAFPAFTTILAVFNHRLHASAAVRVLKGISAGLYTAATFFLIIAVTIVRLGTTTAFVLAIVAGLFMQAASLVFVRRMQ
jgi:hypothetical protein